LTPGQAARSVTFDFEKVSSVKITLALGKGKGLRNTFFSFEPSLACLDGSDPDMPLVPAEPVDPNAPTEDVCPLITKGDGKAYAGDKEVNIGAHGSFMSCFTACRKRVPDANGITSSKGFKNSQWEYLQQCFCERQQIGTSGSGDRLNVFCPVWKPNCNIDLADECIKALVLRGGLTGVTFNDYE